MKSIALIAILFLVSCASSTDVIDERNLGCGPGQDIDVMAGLDKSSLERGSDNRVELLVNVANNSHEELTVKLIRVEQLHRDDAPVLIESAMRRFDQLLPEGKEHTFNIPLLAQVRAFTEPSGSRVGNLGRGTQLTVTVALSNGDSYRCEFDVGETR